MSGLVQRLQTLPWKALLQVSGLSMLVFVAIDISLGFGSLHSALVRQWIRFLFIPVLARLMNEIAGLGLGALSVALLERFCRQRVQITAEGLWALFCCLLGWLLIAYSLPLPGLILSLGQIPFLGVLIGIFWKGRPYHHWSSRSRKY